MIVRPIEAADAGAARAMLSGGCGEPCPYAARVLELLDGALGGATTEQQALISADGDAIVGVAIYGHVAGTKGAAILYVIAIATGSEHRGFGAALLRDVRARLTREGARVVMAELPDEPDARPLLDLLERSGFHEEARIPDYYRDGVALSFLRLDLLPRMGHGHVMPTSIESSDTAAAD